MPGMSARAHPSRTTWGPIPWTWWNSSWRSKRNSVPPNTP
ncbi:hypothetical protein GBAR_LOCUS16124 [Geodia barretti]|uniref:Uncharacterized protein n=1 Tax=Geodia barretti TaxID=519541 RepID=A0AA35SDT7_GEOBA|nr:hypothetical protein GBAR_LOCUS16124 [Geodia barretti]